LPKKNEKIVAPRFLFYYNRRKVILDAAGRRFVRRLPRPTPPFRRVPYVINKEKRYDAPRF